MTFAAIGATDRIACVDHTLVTALQRGDDVDAHTAAVQLRRFMDGAAECIDSLHVFADLLQSRGDVRGEWLAKWFALQVRPIADLVTWVRDAATFADTWNYGRLTHVETHTWHSDRNTWLSRPQRPERRRRFEVQFADARKTLLRGWCVFDASSQDVWHMLSYDTSFAGEGYEYVSLHLMALGVCEVEYVDTPVAVRPPNP